MPFFRDRLRISLLFLAILCSVTAQAATHIVCPGVLCNFETIQEAIDAASPDDTIIVNKPVHTEADILVFKDITIKGLGQDSTVVQASDTSPFEEDIDEPDGIGHSVFVILGGREVVIRDLTIRHGSPASGGESPGEFLRTSGGGIYNAGKLTLIAATVTHNLASMGGGIENKNEGAKSGNNTGILIVRGSRVEHNISTESGGGISNSGRNASLRVEAGSIISDNEAEKGGGVTNLQGRVFITDSEIRDNWASGNKGGGLHIKRGETTIINSTIAKNRAGSAAGGEGGGIFAKGGHSSDNILSIFGTTFTANEAKSGAALVARHSSVFVVDSTFDSNIGESAFLLDGFATGDVRSSTFSRNQSDHAIFNGGTSLGLYNSTISSNQAQGIHNKFRSSLDLVNSTIAFHGPGTGLQNQGNAKASNTLIAENATDCDGGVTAINPNLDSDGTCGFSKTGSANLGPLKNNGGPTETHALLPGSEAIDAGDNSVCARPEIANEDQRGEPRPQGPDCDLGAYEAAGLQETVTAAFLLGGPGAAIVTWLHGLCEWDGSAQQGDCSGEVSVPSNVTVGIEPLNGSLLGVVLINGTAQAPVDNGDGTFTLVFPVNSADSDIEVQIEIEPAPTYRLHLFGGGEDGVADVFADYHTEDDEIVVAIDCEVQGSATVPPSCISPEIPAGVILVLRAVAATPQDSLLMWTGCDEGLATISPDGQQGECVVTMDADRFVWLTVDREEPRLVIEGDDTGTGSGEILCVQLNCSFLDLHCDIYPGGDTNPTPCEASLSEWDGRPEILTAYAAPDSIITDWAQGCDASDPDTWIAEDKKSAQCVVALNPPLVGTTLVTIKLDLAPPPPPPPPPPENRPIVVGDTSDADFVDPAGNFPGIGDLSKLDEVIAAIAQWFDENSNLFQRFWLIDSETGDKSIIRQTGDLDEDGEVKHIDAADVFRPGIIVARVLKTAGDGSDFENLDAHYDPPDVVPFSTIVGQGASVAPPLRSGVQSTSRSWAKGVGDSTVESIGKFASNDPHFVVQVSYVGEGDAMLSADIDNVPIPLVELFRAGDALGDGFTFDSFEPGAVPGIALNPNGDGAVVANVIDPGSGLPVDGLLTFHADTPGAALLLHEGEATELPGVVVTRIVNVSMDAGGVIAVLGRVGGSGISGSNDETVWVCMSGLCSIAVRDGMEPEGMPGVQLMFIGSPVVHNGTLLMRTVLQGAGIDNTNNFGLLLVDLGTGAINLVSQKGDDFGGATITEFVAKAFSNDIPLVLVRLNTFAHVLARVTDAGLLPLIQPGDQFEMPDGTIGTVSSVNNLTETGGEDGRRSAVGGGGYAIVVSFEDGRSGIVACNAACLMGSG